MRHLLIVFHTQSARTQALALACYAGSQSAVADDAHVQVRLRRCVDADCSDVLWAHALIILTPENFSALAGGMKNFFDRVFYPLERAQCVALPYCMVVSAGTDGHNAVAQTDKILSGLRAKKIQEALIFYGEPDAAARAQCVELGLAVAMGLHLGVF